MSYFLVVSKSSLIYSQMYVLKKYLKDIIITAKIFSVMITITLYVFEPTYDYNYI